VCARSLIVTAMAQYEAFQAANAEYVAAFSKGDLPMPPARKAAVVICMARAPSLPRRHARACARRANARRHRARRRARLRLGN
jgi:hypothetical protein